MTCWTVCRCASIRSAGVIAPGGRPCITCPGSPQQQQQQPSSSSCRQSPSLQSSMSTTSIDDIASQKSAPLDASINLSMSVLDIKSTNN
ncbi:hypothetical protein HCN44_003236 [Aphidius gifuensis]|uniref:Uncharacterized protein n=1 Tax=Aphidius gifuensis TaxID=684658 RepID=A0A834XLC8_APHGI|nr:hypothetical protein HCN44_003236 [Aphidius gifuensis]